MKDEHPRRLALAPLPPNAPKPIGEPPFSHGAKSASAKTREAPSMTIWKIPREDFNVSITLKNSENTDPATLTKVSETIMSSNAKPLRINRVTCVSAAPVSPVVTRASPPLEPPKMAPELESAFIEPDHSDPSSVARLVYCKEYLLSFKEVSTSHLFKSYASQKCRDPPAGLSAEFLTKMQSCEYQVCFL